MALSCSQPSDFMATPTSKLPPSTSSPLLSFQLNIYLFQIIQPPSIKYLYIEYFKNDLMAIELKIILFQKPLTQSPSYTTKPIFPTPDYLNLKLQARLAYCFSKLQDSYFN